MVKFTAVLKKLFDAGEKTGWTVIDIPAEIAEKIAPGVRKSFRVKGLLDKHPIAQAALMPMGGGDFILTINAPMRKGIAKRTGAKVQLQLELDTAAPVMNEELMECLQDAPEAYAFWNTLATSHRRYFSNWVSDAKTDATRAKRIAATITAMERNLNYGEMIRAQQAEKKNGGPGSF